MVPDCARFNCHKPSIATGRPDGVPMPCQCRPDAVRNVFVCLNANVWVPLKCRRVDGFQLSSGGMRSTDWTFASAGPRSRSTLGPNWIPPTCGGTSVGRWGWSTMLNQRTHSYGRRPKPACARPSRSGQLLTSWSVNSSSITRSTISARRKASCVWLDENLLLVKMGLVMWLVATPNGKRVDPGAFPVEPVAPFGAEAERDGLGDPALRASHLTWH